MMCKTKPALSQFLNALKINALSFIHSRQVVLLYRILPNALPFVHTSYMDSPYIKLRNFLNADKNIVHTVHTTSQMGFQQSGA